MKVEIGTTERDNTFDNIKGILIILVVLGHMLSSNTKGSILIKTIYSFIYIFHMPAFIFITGYFSKNVDKSRDKAFSSFLIPYIIFNILYTLLGKVGLYRQYLGIRIFNPVYGIWFLLAMFIWKIILKDMVKIRFILPIAFIIGILCGFSEEFGTYMTLARIINYLPFFLLGYYTNKEHVKKMKDFPKWIACLLFTMIAIIVYIITKYKLLNLETIYMRKSYEYAKQSITASVLGRMFIYLAATIIIICFINIFENKIRWYTQLGRNSLTVYILHLFIVVNLKDKVTLFNDSKWYTVYAIIISVFIAYILSRNIFTVLYNKFMGFVNTLIYKKVEQK